MFTKMSNIKILNISGHFYFNFVVKFTSTLKFYTRYSIPLNFSDTSILIL